MNVEELLQTKKVSYIPKGKDFVVKCLNPEHDDSNPSMRIDQITGIFNCFSCQFTGNIFSFFGERPQGLQIRRELLKKKIDECRSESVGLSYPKNAVMYQGNWREIKPETYKKFGAFTCIDSPHANRLVFPIYDRSGRIVAFIGRHMTMGSPKYLNSPPGAKMPLYPVVEPIQGSVILVEGIFDMLNLHDKGLTNAICCFGVKNVNEERLQILSMQGIDSINIFLDNDDAGQKGAQNIRELCEKIGLKATVIQFGSKELDAGALTQTQVNKLKSRLYA